MTHGKARKRPARALLAAAIGLAICASGAHAQSAPSENATINLVRLLVKRGVLTQSDADGLIAQANADAASAQKAAGTANAVPAVPGQVRVTYVPEVVRNQIKDELRQEVVAQAKDEHWAEPGKLPEWLDRIAWTGDLRVRDEFHYYDKGNATQQVDFAALNRNGPYDLNGVVPPPQLNTLENRTNSLRIRARLGVNLTLGDGVTAGIRIGTGGDNNPVSTTQNLGGGLAKKSLWLDQAWIAWSPSEWVKVTGGRMPNPFLSTNLVYADDLNFDGIASHFDVPATDDISTFATVGMFPIEYQSDDFPAQSGAKTASRDKWMTGAQLGASWKFADDIEWKFALAYYRFDHMQGQLSDPCPIYLGVTYCSTDASRPAYMQKGNSLFLIRDIIPDPNSPSSYAQPQFVGLVYDYHVANAITRLDMNVMDTPLRIEGDYIRNMAYHRKDAFRADVGVNRLVNNFGAGDFAESAYKSGPVGWMLRATLGKPQPNASGDWNVTAGYKYIQPDATLDGLNDPDFHLGGTNAKGFILTGSYGISKYSWLSLRYFNAKEVFGPPLSIDVFQLDLNAKF